MVKEMKQAVKETKKGIMITMEELQASLAAQQSAIDTVKQSKASLQTEIRILSEQAMDLIKQKEKELVDELDELTEEQTGQLRGQIKSGEIYLQMHQQYSEFIDQALRSESQVNLYDVYQMCQSGAAKCSAGRESDARTISPLNKITLTFGTSFEFGRLQLQDVLPDHTRKPYDTIYTRTYGDEMIPYQCDVTILNIHVDGVDTMVVADRSNSNVKSFFAKSNRTRTSTLNLQDSPFTVTHLKDNLVAVTDATSEITVVKVTPDIALHSRITTEKGYRCLTAVDSNTLAGICDSPHSIDFLDLSGKVHRSLTRWNASGLDLTSDPRFLCSTNKGHILVSDQGSHPVYCLILEGDVMFTHHPEGDRALHGIRGITTTPSGEILVVGMRLNKVIQLTERGEFVRELLTSQDGLLEPYGICLHGDSLYITEYSRGTV